MPFPILMPALSPTMTEGKLARWLMKEGEAVKPGDALAEIETDKATMEIECVDEGVLGKILVADGTEKVAVNAPIGLILAPGEDAASLSSAPPVAQPKLAPAHAAAAPAPAPASALATPPSQRLFASPLARRLARERGIDLAALSGSGPRGRILKDDVLKARSATSQAASALPPPGASTGFEAIAHSSMRKVVAERLTLAKSTIPHFYLTIDCQIDKLLDARRRINERFPEGKLSVNDFIIKAAALALKQVPGCNASWTEAAILRFAQVDISIAVATPSGLITPILRQADHKGLGALSTEMKELAERARAGKLKPEEYQGGGFTISNLGMYGVREFAAIINPPQACILAVGAGEPRVIVLDGKPAIATMMSCTLSVDHRVVDGVMGAEFLAAFKKLVEEPVAMLL
jgi:pyruvate dehydrogenase E2 component (dihydrolipoamide acetyltransferase)